MLLGFGICRRAYFSGGSGEVFVREGGVQGGREEGEGGLPQWGIFLKMAIEGRDCVKLGGKGGGGGGYIWMYKSPHMVLCSSMVGISARNSESSSLRRCGGSV